MSSIPKAPHNYELILDSEDQYDLIEALSVFIAAITDEVEVGRIVSLRNYLETVFDEQQ